MSLFTSMVLGFGVGVNLNLFLNKFICISVNGLNKRLIILRETFTLSSRFDLNLAFLCVSNDFSMIEYVNSVCSIILCCCEGNISSSKKYSFLSVLPDDNTNILLLLL